jgi:CheY-like chemotaxis protein
MSAELLPRVFDPFVQDPQSIDRRQGGLGIGLAIVRNLAALHGGTIAATSDGPGMGSQFVIRLPLVTAGVVAVPAHATRIETSGQNVLVVDDNVDAAEMIGELLRAYGHDVTVVHHPDEALALVQDLAPHTALLDIGLPGMDGYQLASRLRTLAPACRLVALTGYGQEADRVRGTAAGFVAHLVKPADINELLAAIQA